MQAETKQMRIADAIVMEMDQEAEITKRLLDIIPEDKLGWRPHPKAKSLGELAMHSPYYSAAWRNSVIRTSRRRPTLRPIRMRSAALKYSKHLPRASKRQKKSSALPTTPG